MTPEERALAEGMYERGEAVLTDWQRSITYNDCILVLRVGERIQPEILYGRILCPDEVNGADPQIRPHFFVAVVYRPDRPPAFEPFHSSVIRAVLTWSQMDAAGAAGWPQTSHAMLMAIEGNGKPVVLNLTAHKAPVFGPDGPLVCVATPAGLSTMPANQVDQQFAPDGYVRSLDWSAELTDLNNVALTWRAEQYSAASAQV